MSEFLTLLLVQVSLALTHRRAVSPLAFLQLGLRVVALVDVEGLGQQVFVLLQELVVEGALVQVLQNVGLRSAPAGVFLHAEANGLSPTAVVRTNIGTEHEFGRVRVVAAVVNLREDDTVRALDAFVGVESTPDLPKYSSP